MVFHQYLGGGEINIDECAVDPCVHGECKDGIAEYNCICEPGWEGKNCEIEINECARYQPCAHGSCTGKTITFSITSFIKLPICDDRKTKAENLITSWKDAKQFFFV